MDVAAIANQNNFRQLVERIETVSFSKVNPYQAILSVYLVILSMLAGSECIIIIFDIDGEYLYYNRLQKYNLIADDVVGKTPSDIFDIETAFKIINHVLLAAYNVRAVQTESSISWNGGFLPFLNYMRPIDVSGISRASILR